MKRILLECGGVCTFPGCSRSLVSPDSPTESGAVLAEIAHIVADSREGPRGDVGLSEDQRNQHDNLIALCPDHHKVIDSQAKTYSIDVLRQMKLDHLAAVRKKLHPELPDTLPTLTTEKIQSSILAVSHLPQAVYEAKCAFGAGQEEEVRLRISAPKGREVLLPYVLAGGKLLCFQNLRRRHNPFWKAVDSGSARAIPAQRLWENDDGRRLYVRLMNRSLYKYAGHRDVRYDVLHRRFFFVPEKKGQTRSVRYKSLTGRGVQRNVVWQPVRRKTGEVSKVWWHVAAGLRFHFVAPMQWCFSIRPEWHLTKDGEIVLEPKRIGRRVTSKKSRMFNYQYLREVSFWRDFLSGGTPRILLNFDDQFAVINSEIISFSVSWPGIPGDLLPFESNLGEDDLFTLAEFQDATELREIGADEDEEEVDSENLDEF